MRDFDIAAECVGPPSSGDMGVDGGHALSGLHDVGRVAEERDCVDATLMREFQATVFQVTDSFI